MQTVRTVTVCRVLVVPRSAYQTIKTAFPLGTRQMLDNLQAHAEMVSIQKAASKLYCLISVNLLCLMCFTNFTTAYVSIIWRSLQAQQGWHSRAGTAGTAGSAGLAQQAQQGSLAVPSCWRCSLPDCAVVAQIVEEEFKHTAAKLGVTGQEASALAHQWASPEATGFPSNPKDPQDSAHKELHKPHLQGTL